MQISFSNHGVHHLEGHLYSPFLSAQGEPSEEIPEHFTGLVVSGGHTSLLNVDGGKVTSLIETRDDAMGEVFDKVGKRLGLPFPGGAAVDALAERGDAKACRFSIARWLIEPGVMKSLAAASAVVAARGGSPSGVSTGRSKPGRYG